jgi:hypothetical protein
MVAYFLASPTDGRATGKDLVRVVQRNLLPVQEVPGEPQVLVRGVSEAIVELFDGTTWSDSWDSEATSTLSVALKLRFSLVPHGNSQVAPAPIEVIVPVWVKTNASAQAEAEAASVL